MPKWMCHPSSGPPAAARPGERNQRVIVLRLCCSRAYCFSDFKIFQSKSDLTIMTGRPAETAPVKSGDIRNRFHAADDRTQAPRSSPRRLPNGTFRGRFSRSLAPDWIFFTFAHSCLCDSPDRDDLLIRLRWQARASETAVSPFETRTQPLGRPSKLQLGHILKFLSSCRRRFARRNLTCAIVLFGTLC
jgi:hypothetical protein